MVALIVGDRTVEFAELERRVGGECRRLAALPAGVLLLRAEPSLDFVVRWLAALEASRPAAIFSPHWSLAEQASRRALLGPSLELASDGSVVSATPGSARCHPETALVLFTTGSSGTPKAVQLSRASIEANATAVMASLGLESGGEQTLFLPLSSGFGLLGQLMPALRARIATRLLSRFTDVIGLLDAGPARGVWSGVPSHWEALLRLTAQAPAALEGLTHVVSAGAPLAPGLRSQLRRSASSATLFSNYGQTEAGPRIACLSSEDPDFFSAATGRPVRGIEARVEDGELWVRGPQVMLGYLGDEAATAQALRGGWLRTGDLARIAADGLITIEGRRDELFNVAGERTSPVEVEQALAEVPGVREAAVVVRPDAVYGSRICALLVCEPGATGASAGGLSAALVGRLAPHKHPREYYSVDALPRFPNGKLLRAALAATMAGGRKL